MEKKGNKPLWLLLQELPWGSCLKEQLLSSSVLLHDPKSCTLQKESTGPWKDASNQYDNIKAADYHFEDDIMGVMIAVDKGIEW